MILPTLNEIIAARDEIGQFVPPSPQYRWPLLCERLATDVWVKHENTTPIGSFKIRGGIHYMQTCEADHVITATRGNHGQSVAMAAGLFGKKVSVYVPRNNSVSKNNAMRALGATLIEHGRDFSETHDEARRIASEKNLHLVPSFDRRLVVGVSTFALELFEHVTDLDSVYVPIGMGSEICAVIAAREALGLNRVEIIGVVAENAPAYALSFAQNKLIETDSAITIADGLAVRIPNAEALDVIFQYVARIVEVSEQQIAEAMRHYFTDTHHVVEGAGASTLAALIKEKNTMQGKKVAIIASGGNVDIDLYMRILSGQTLA